MTLYEEFLRDARVLRAKDIQQLMNWTDSTLRARIDRHQMPPGAKKGGTTFYRWEDVEEWLLNERPISVYAVERDAAKAILK